MVGGSFLLAKPNSPDSPGLIPLTQSFESRLEPVPPSFEALMAMSQLTMAGGVSLGQAVAGFESSLKTFRPFRPVETAAAFGGLLTVPELQSNCIRLEGLTHIAIAYCSGKKRPTATEVSRWFAKFGRGWLGQMEDPAEDVFVSNIATPRGNFRVLEGVWESGAFSTQRMVNVAEGMPKTGGYETLRDSVYALLTLSDIVCERAGLLRYQLGVDVPADALSARQANSISALQRRVRFSRAEVEGRGISWDALAAFVFDPNDRRKLIGEAVGNSTLERYPLVADSGWLYLVLPTAVTAAIRRYLVESMIAGGMRAALANGIGAEYGAFFSKLSLLGGSRGGQIQFQRRPNGLVCATMRAVDVGRYLNLVLFVDMLVDIESTGIAGLQPNLRSLASDIEIAIDQCCAEARKDPEFRDGITLVVGCGIGRAVAGFLQETPRLNWRVEHVAAADLATLSWLDEFKPLSLWRLLDARDSVEADGIELANVNGLLNLVAWARKLDGHIVPHQSLPASFGGGPRLLLVQQNSLRSLRHHVATYWDPHAERDVTDKWRNVRKNGDSLFKEDMSRPIYGTEERVGRFPLIVFPTALRSWWGALVLPDDCSGDIGYQRAKVLMVWLVRIAPVLEVGLPGLPEGALCWRLNFKEAVAAFDKPPEQATFEETLADIGFDCDKMSRTVTVTLGRRYEDAVFHPENIAERALVTRSVEGFAEFAAKPLTQAERDALVAQIIPDTAARETHAFREQQFRDRFRGLLSDSPLTIDTEDDAAFRFGLGWRVRDRANGGDIRGKDACTAYLNALVRYVEDELCAALREFDRKTLVELALINHESAAMERDWWSRTASAVLALRADKDAARGTMARQEFRLAGAFQASRLLIELAVCECPLAGGRKPGELDFSRLMAKMAFIQHAGGWSDAIRWDVMEPQVTISPLGDIFVDYKFVDNILVPYGRAGSDLRVDDAVKDYAKNLEEPELGPASAEGLLGVSFLAAWNEQFGASFDDTRYFVDAVERLGYDRNEVVFTIRKSELIAAKYRDAPVAAAAVLVEELSLKPRANWRDVPPGFEERDLHPWRFRRRLTALRRPLIQIDDADDPMLIIAPGLMRDALGYMLRGYRRGDFPPRQLKPLMRAFAGKAADEQGSQFTRDVAARLNELGWRTDTEVKITKLLRKGFERDFGDVDVLAWNPETERVLIIECKDVQFRKSFGEIAEQLADFRGETGPDGKPDLLLKHLNRMALISAHLPELATYVKIPNVAVAESHLVFKNPVPMQFAWQRLEARVRLNLFSTLETL